MSRHPSSDRRSVQEAELVRRHYGLAIGIARRFEKRGDDREDLQQVALMALTQAIRRFDPERGTQLSTYATAVVVGSLKRYLRDSSWGVRPSRGQHDRYLAIQADIDLLAQQLGRAPTAAEISTATGRPIEDVIEAHEIGRLAVNEPLARPGDDATPLEVPYEDCAFLDVERRELVRSVLASLPERDRTMLYMRFFLSSTQTDIAARLGVSQMEVSRSLGRVLSRLRVVLSHEAGAAAS